MGTPLYHIIASLGTIFFRENAVWATRPLDATPFSPRFHSAQRMIGSHPLLQVYRIIKELRVALVLSHHDGNTLLAHLPQLGYFFLSSQADLGNTPFRSDPDDSLPNAALWLQVLHQLIDNCFNLRFGGF